MSTKCIVHGCENHEQQGTFIGALCTPCYVMLKTGELNHGNTFIHKRIAELERERDEFKRLWFTDADPEETPFAAEFLAAQEAK